MTSTQPPPVAGPAHEPDEAAVELAAQAARRVWQDANQPAANTWTWEQISETHRAIWRDVARAALSAAAEYMDGDKEVEFWKAEYRRYFTELEVQRRQTAELIAAAEARGRAQAAEEIAQRIEAECSEGDHYNRVWRAGSNYRAYEIARGYGAGQVGT